MFAALLNNTTPERDAMNLYLKIILTLIFFLFGWILIPDPMTNDAARGVLGGMSLMVGLWIGIGK